MSARLIVMTAILLCVVSMAGVSFEDVAAQAVPPGQGPGRIAGTVTGDAGQPLVSAAITIRSPADSSIVTGAMTTRDGKFRIDGLPLGRYLVRVSIVGYTPRDLPTVELTSAQPAQELGVLKLDVAPVALPGVQADAARPPAIMEADRTTYSTKDLPAAMAGGTVTEMLRQVPELEVDINGKVALRGNLAVAIHLNGRPLPLRGDALNNFLNQLPANRVSKVEVMPNPSAAHDPSGMGGIVNIILKDNIDLGLSGSVAANINTRKTRGLNTNLAYQKGKFTFFGGGNYSLYDSRSNNSDFRQNLLARPITSLESEGRAESNSNNHSYNFSAEFKFNPKTVVWLTGYGYGNGSESEQIATYGLYDEARLRLDHYDRLSDNEYGYASRDIALGFKHSIVPQRHELILDLRRTSNDQDGESFTQKFSRLDPGFPLLEVRTSDTDNSSPGTWLRADYNRPWGARGRIAVGLTSTLNEIDNRILNTVDEGNSTTPMEQTRSHYTYDENFSAAYSTVAQTFGRLGVQLGLRWEVTRTDFTLRTTDQEFDRKYNSVFPTLNLTWDAKQGRTIRLNYSKRIMRPYADILNPFVPISDPLNIYTGNPDLKAAYTHSIGLDFSKTGARWTFRMAPSFRRTYDNWEQIRQVDSVGVSRMTWHNSASTTVYGTTFSASLRPLGRLSGSASFSATHTITDAHNISADLLRRASTRFSVGGNASAKITPTLTGSMNGTFIPAYVMAQGSRSASFMSSLSLRQQFMNNRAVLAVSANDPLDLYRYRFETRDRTHVQTNRTVPRQRTATVSFTWNFGKPPEQNSRTGESTTTAAPVIIR